MRKTPGYVKKKRDRTDHILLRYSDNIAPLEGTIKAHEEVIKKNGSVWMGKFGKRAGKPIFMTFKDQIANKEPAYVFMIKSGGNRKSYTIHAAVVEDISFDNPDRKLIPKYYANKLWMVKSWFKISKFIKLDQEILRTLIGKTSMLPILGSVRKSMAGMMYVTLSNKKNIKDFKIR
jgi:hypothetical protein